MQVFRIANTVIVVKHIVTAEQVIAFVGEAKMEQTPAVELNYDNNTKGLFKCDTAQQAADLLKAVVKAMEECRE